MWNANLRALGLFPRFKHKGERPFSCEFFHGHVLFFFAEPTLLSCARFSNSMFYGWLSVAGNALLVE